jgi:threonyl-tRNA synthetase
MNNKIRQAQVQKIPYMLVIGDREQEAQEVNLRLRDGNKPGSLSVADLIVQIQDADREHRVL